MNNKKIIHKWKEVINSDIVKDKKYYEEQASEEEFLEWYHKQDLPTYKKPSVTVDIIVLKYDQTSKQLQVLTIKRKRNPWRNKWTLIGGFVNPNEDIVAAGIRELHEETNLTIDKSIVKQLPAWSKPNRDPRDWVITNPLLIQLKFDTNLDLHASDDAKDFQWINLQDIANMEFASDHKEILQYAIETLRSRLQTQRLNAIRNLLTDKFTLNTLQHIIEQITDTKIQKTNLKRKYKDMLIEDESTVDTYSYKGFGRPEKQYQLK